MAKNIVIFSDGTGQEGGLGHNTNVYALFNMIVDRTDAQISFYDRGLGTGKGRIGAISGFGLSKNVGEAYQFLVDNFCAGDQIFMFGFSRGATTVRTLSAFIAMFGILPRSRPELFRRAWRIYQSRNLDKRRIDANEFVLRNHTMWTKIRLIGVWDTVAALGFPIQWIDRLIDKIPFFRHSYHNFEMADSVEYGRHALSIDDKRPIFHPVLWDERGPRRDSVSARGENLFSVNDVGDIYQVVEKLKEEENAVSVRVKDMLSDSTTELLLRFERPAVGRASKKKADDMRAIIVEEFNRLIQGKEAIYDPKKNRSQLAELEEQVQLSASTRECIAKLHPSYALGIVPNPSRFSIPRLNRLLLEDTYSMKSRIKQVWFAGMHSDVGGGYVENELGQVPLMWMLSEATDLGLHIYPKHNVDLKPDPTGVMHDSSSGKGRVFGKPKARQWLPEQHQGRQPLVHESVVTRYADDPLYDPWILKTDYDVEPSPDRLEISIQYDDVHVWREGFWGWGATFDLRWEEIKRISHDERAVTIHTGPDRDDIFIQGSLPRALPILVERLEAKREQQRLAERNAQLERQDEKQRKATEEVQKRLDKLEAKLGNNNDAENQMQPANPSLLTEVSKDRGIK